MSVQTLHRQKEIWFIMRLKRSAFKCCFCARLPVIREENRVRYTHSVMELKTSRHAAAALWTDWWTVPWEGKKPAAGPVAESPDRAWTMGRWRPKT